MRALLLIAGVAGAGLLFMTRETGDGGGEDLGDAWRRFDALFKRYGAASGVDWKWLKAICMNESDLGENELVKRGVASSDGLSYGVMQLRPSTASDYVPGTTAAKLNDPDFSIRVAAQHVARLQTLFPTVEVRYVEWVIKSYNQGEGRTAQERTGARPGTAGAAEYWARFQRNLSRVEKNV